ncbi:Myo-inositol 2-dehydrogenase [Agrobacterium tumefaciens str. Kerr 14]|uniref:Myo-inositol 2-dehydrogenase n=1 Tax=Agrobacterium tumefaciens str. Kerr 14 TaxID=1183424 RepID=A0A1S7SA93_AGRTU|nr:Gfo/Idh/MocA family oxidoreductase [Agrobacterium tumefaciens]CUX65265.1 Myo-inositol 2-dehydrogenase [Agrobacterium tumefaciens str. Kerr 14]
MEETLERLRFGIIGSGYMAKTHSLALRNLESFIWPGMPKIERVRLADINEALANESARRWGWSEATTDWKKVTRADDIDVVVIITPNDSHEEIAVDAFEHGKHVFCEKPLAQDLAAAKRMAAAARKSGKINLVNFVYRCWPAIQFASKLIAEGELGELRHFEGHFFQDYANDASLPFAWRFDKSKAGGGAFGDIGSHITDIAVSLMGPIGRVAANTRTYFKDRSSSKGSKPVTVDDMTTALVEFQSGATGSIHASWAATGHKSDLAFTVIGSKGSLTFSWERNNEIHLYTEQDQKDRAGFRRIMLGGIHPEAEPFWYAQGQGLGYGESFVITARRLVEAIRNNNTAAGPSFAEAVHINAVVEAVFSAAETRSWQVVDNG